MQHIPLATREDAMTEKYLAAAIQMDSQEDKKENLKAAAALIDEAAARNAKLIALPEMWNYFGREKGEFENAEPIGGETTLFLQARAKRHGVWLHGGSICECAEGKERVYNTSLLISPKGDIAAVYRKMHLFDVEVASGPSYKESNAVIPGSDIAVAETELGCMGLSICYDIRFPELYRIVTLQGAQVIFAPAGFTLFTGRDHWEPILRTRAIECGTYVIAPNQIGKKTTFQTQGKTMIVDPWGNVIAKASDYPGVITAEIDLNYIATVRAQVPSLANRRTDIYTRYADVLLK